MPFKPAAMHSHQPRYPELAPVRGHCGSVCCRPRELRRHLHRSAFAASDALAHPRRGTLRKTRLVFALHPALPGSGQGCSAFRPGRPPHSRPGGNVTPKSVPEVPPSRACCSASPSRKPVCRRSVRREANTLLMRPEYGSHRLSEPPARLFLITGGAPGRSACASLASLGSPFDKLRAPR
jgi:hypothetical protein